MSPRNRNGRELPWTVCTCRPRHGLHSAWCEEGSRPSPGLTLLAFLSAALLGGLVWAALVGVLP